MKIKILNKKKKGSALIIGIFTAIVGLLTTVTLINISESNTNQITDNKSGSIAYYAAEAGLEEIKNLFNSDYSLLGTELSSLDLPQVETEHVLNNSARYWIDSLEYQNNNKEIIANIIGEYEGAFRKIRTKMETSIPSIYDDYGLLTDGVLTIHGTKVLKMSVHANNGLSFSGGTTMENNAVASQSSDSSASAPDPLYNNIGGYIPNVEVPQVPIDEYRTKSKEDGLIYNINDSDLTTKIKNAPINSKIYISMSAKDKNKVLYLSGDMQNKFIFVDGNIKIYSNGMENLSNVMVTSAGKMEVDGSADVSTSHDGHMDVVFAAGDDVTLNGSRSFTSLFWSNGRFTQNGASLAGRVIAQEAILFNGSFTLNQSNKLYDNGSFERSINVATWQVVSMEE